MYQNLTLKFLLGILKGKSESNDSLIQFVECLDLGKCERTVTFLGARAAVFGFRSNQTTEKV